MENARRIRRLRLLSGLAFLGIYTLLHEGGHALAVVALGGRVETFDLNFLNLGAHVAYSGAFTTAQSALIHVAGPLLPALAWMAWQGWRPAGASRLSDWLRVLSLLGITASVLAWVVIPVLALGGRAPAGDDCTRFLEDSGLSPLLVTGLAASLLAACWGLAWWRLGSPVRIFRRVRLRKAPSVARS